MFEFSGFVVHRLLGFDGENSGFYTAEDFRVGTDYASPLWILRYYLDLHLRENGLNYKTITNTLSLSSNQVCTTPQVTGIIGVYTGCSNTMIFSLRYLLFKGIDAKDIFQLTNIQNADITGTVVKANYNLTNYNYNYK